MKKLTTLILLGILVFPGFAKDVEKIRLLFSKSGFSIEPLEDPTGKGNRQKQWLGI